MGPSKPTFGDLMDVFDLAAADGEVQLMLWLRDFSRFRLGPHGERAAEEVIEKLADLGYTEGVYQRGVEIADDPVQYARNSIAHTIRQLRQYNEIDTSRLDYEIDELTRHNLSVRPKPF